MPPQFAAGTLAGMEEHAYRKYVSDASDRNKQPILDVLSEVLPESGTVLEISSGTGQHAVHMAGALPGIVWQPTDIDPQFRESVEAWRAESGLPNILPPLHLDVTEHPWPVARADAIFNANMIHIAPWECCLGLLDGAARVLPEGSALVMYGPYKIGGEHTAPSNEAFDANLQSRDPSWGIRDLDVVAAEAKSRGLALVRTYQMPANNLSVVYRKA